MELFSVYNKKNIFLKKLKKFGKSVFDFVYLHYYQK